MKGIESQNKTPEPFSISEAEIRLQKIFDILTEMGLTIIERNKEKIFEGKFEYPIIEEGFNAIRASYSKREGLKISFTNLFEDRNKSPRKEIEQRLKELGLL